MVKLLASIFRLGTKKEKGPGSKNSYRGRLVNT